MPTLSRRALLLASGLGLLSAVAEAGAPGHGGDVEPELHIASLPSTGERVVALTFDACMGETDERILATLVDHAIPATIFATRRWIHRNPAALATLLAHPDLFQIENHGDSHLPAITDQKTMFGLKTAGTIEAVRAEVAGGAAAILSATGIAPRWFRGATARYSRDAVAEINAEGYRIAGYSLNADMGASLSAKTVARRMAAARSGDVIIAHINQPHRPAGAGVVEGILALQQSGTRFVRLEDVATLV